MYDFPIPLRRRILPWGGDSEKGYLSCAVKESPLCPRNRVISVVDDDASVRVAT